MKLTHKTKTGKIATADVITTAPSTAANRRKGNNVYRVTEFRLPGDRSGWRLIDREYRTRAGLLRAARKLGMGIIE